MEIESIRNWAAGKLTAVQFPAVKFLQVDEILRTTRGRTGDRGAPEFVGQALAELLMEPSDPRQRDFWTLPGGGPDHLLKKDRPPGGGFEGVRPVEGFLTFAVEKLLGRGFEDAPNIGRIRLPGCSDEAGHELADGSGVHAFDLTGDFEAAGLLLGLPPPQGMEIMFFLRSSDKRLARGPGNPG